VLKLRLNKGDTFQGYRDRFPTLSPPHIAVFGGIPAGGGGGAWELGSGEEEREEEEEEEGAARGL
jgi:hypothetical protein